MPRVSHADQLPRLSALVWREPVAPGDDDALAAAAVAHRLEGYADEALAGGRWRPAEEVARSVRDARGRSALRGTLLRRELASVAPVLRDACGVPPIVVKGPALAERVHGERTLRPYDDLDVLVPLAALRPAADALVAAGWTWSAKPGAVGASGEPFAGWAEAYGHELHLRRAIGAHIADLELHWRVSDDAAAAGLAYERLAAGAAPLPGLGEGVLAPHPADELLVVALHLLHHRRVRLMWAVDVALARDGLSAADWERAFATARELELSWALHTALDRSEALLGRGRERPEDRPRRARFGALRATQALPGRLGQHVGRLAGLSWGDRGRYAAAIGGATWRRALNRAAGR